MPRAWRLALLAAAVACGGGGADTGFTAEPPDITGRYNAQLRWASGCEGDASWVEDWAAGPLTVSDAGGGILEFDFGEGMAFSGGVGATGGYSFSGELTWAGAALSVQHDGEAGEDEEGRRLLSGTFAVRVDEDGLESNDCTVEAGMEAYLLADADGGAG